MEPRVSIIALGVAGLARSHRFYHQGMGLPTTRNPDSGIVFFQTSGVCLALYPIDKLAEDFAHEQSAECGPFSGITLAHNTRTKDEVDPTLQQADGVSEL